MDPVGLCRVLSFKTHHELTMCLPGKWGSAPSVGGESCYDDEGRQLDGVPVAKEGVAGGWVDGEVVAWTGRNGF
jgi:hypothetical protein